MPRSALRRQRCCCLRGCCKDCRSAVNMGPARYMSEVALHRHRGFFASFQYVTLIGGQLLAVLVLVIMQQFLTNMELKSWGWRIPFAIGAVAAVIAFFLRRSLAETTSADVRRKEGAGTIKGGWRS